MGLPTSQPMNSLIDVFSFVITQLHRLQIENMIVGSIASTLYGEPRLTRDLDLVIELSNPSAQLKAFDEFFSTLPDFYCPPLEVLQTEFQERGQFNLIHSPSGLKVDLVLKKNNDHSREEFSRRKTIEIWPGLKAQVAAPEDVILKKLVYFREGGSQKHLTDIRGILAQTTTDQEYLKKWIEKLSLEKEWTMARS